MDRTALSQLSKDDLIALLVAQEARIAELERRLGLNSSNSGKPPSSDGLKKPPRVSSLREPSGKKIGGQNGHPGETLRRVETPNATDDHFPETCPACGEPLTAAVATDHVARQVFDIPGQRAARRSRGVGIAGRDQQRAEADHLGDVVLHSGRIARVFDAPG